MTDTAKRWKVTPWDSHVGRWRKGAKVDLAAIVQLLESGEPVPAEANALLAGLLTGAVVARAGRKPGRMAAPETKRMIARWVANFEAMLTDPAKIPEDFDKQARDRINALRLRREGTPNAKARELIADMYGVSLGTVGACITGENNRLRAIAEEHGVTLADVKRAMGIGDP